jgi:hypothetical protein
VLGCCNSNTTFWVFFFTTIVLVSVVGYILNRWVVRPNASRIMERLELQPNKALDGQWPQGSEGLLLRSLSDEFVARGNASLYIVAEFTQYHYLAIISTILAGTLGGVGAFLVASISWEYSNQALRGFFIACSALVPFWLTATQVFRYPETIAKHETIYVACTNLLSEATHVILCPPKPDESGKAFDLCAYVAEMEKKANAVRAIGVSFDGSRISFAKIELPK